MSDPNPKYPLDTVMVDEEGMRYLVFRDCFAQSRTSNTEFTRKLRPLIVIDPEDEEQVRAAWAALYGSLNAPTLKRFTESLKGLVPEPEGPPIPEVPEGCRMVVDRFDNVWRRSPGCGYSWSCGNAAFSWAKLWANAGPLRPVADALEVSE